MSLYGMMRTGVSGMNAQSGRLSTVADNIANADSIGYKRVSAEFSSMVLSSAFGRYQSGGVLVHNRSHAGEQGALRYTASNTDLAVSGSGYFLVQDQSGAVFMSRSGSFLPNSEGELVNALGYKLLGHPLSDGAPNAIANGFEGLIPVNVSNRFLRAAPSTTGSLNVNLPSTAAITPAGQLPSANAANAQFAAKTSVIAYDSLGQEVTLDVYFAKTSANTWEVSVFNRANATNGGFPYAGGPLETETLTFDPSTGALTGASANSLSVAIPGGETLAIDMGRTTQLASAFAVLEAKINGNAAGAVERVEVDPSGKIVGVLRNGSRVDIAQVAIADVPSPDLLTRETGSLFSVNDLSGTVRVGIPQSGGFGAVIGGALEESTVDIASELTNMIQSQRTYTANSKVFMTGAELMDVLVNLKR
ncbi:MAG: flagellar hook protein FlgE [Rhizobiaceae bacterium]|jgi:flagellar hook protein FlgE|nr:flagellar hook protein FlgE [Rhizobiaceae bacterium]